MPRTAYATCPLCEATCGLELTVSETDQVTRVRGDAEDVLSHGFICPKGATIAALEADPDRLREPLVRRSGRLEPASWEEALALVAERLPGLIAEHGPGAVGVYLGNPVVHNLSLSLYSRVLVRALGTRNLFTASTVDQMPKHVACGLMFGTMTSIPVPDLDRTDHVLMLGANPLASNGSLMTAPDVRGRLRAIRARGGRVVVIDPRRTRTAQEADAHHFIRPGSDALLLAALVRELFVEGRVALGRLAAHVSGVEEVAALVAPFSPEAVSGPTGIDAATVRTLARELADAPRAVVYGRIGTSAQSFGTLASWLVDVLNVLTGNLDREGGAMFPLAAAGQANAHGAGGQGRGVRLGRWSSPVGEHPETYGELPAAAIAEQIEGDNRTRMRALITVAGNPALSTPNAARLQRALGDLEFMVCLDVYRNETTRHADVVLPGPGPLRHSHYDVTFAQLAVRNVAHYSPPVLPADPQLPDEWRTILRLAAILAGQGIDADVDGLDDMVAAAAVARETGTPGARLAGRPDAEILAGLAPRRGPERLLDLMLRSGPYGDGFDGAEGLTLERVAAAPHGIDLGALRPRVPEVLRTASGRIELAPEAIIADVPRLLDALQDPGAPSEMVLIGRRHLRSNNSWMHNVDALVRGPARCTALVHPRDARRLGLVDGALARVRSRAGTLEVAVEVSEEIMPGVVSIPHGWGHDAPDAQLTVAGAHPGVNANRLVDETALDPLSGTAVLNGVPVTLSPVA